MHKSILICKTYFFISLLFLFSSCAIKRPILHPTQNILTDSLLNTAFIGLKIVDLDNNKVLVDLNSHKYFIPASNTKLLSMYGALKTFGDSIPGWFIAEDDESLYIEPNADPTFLHPDFKEQKLFTILRNSKKNIVLILPESNSLSRFGAGWSWSSYRENYSVERNAMPLYANLVQFYNTSNGFVAKPSFFTDSIRNAVSKVNQEKFFHVNRDEQSNSFVFRKGNASNHWSTAYTSQRNDSLSYFLLKDTLEKVNPNIQMSLYRSRPNNLKFREFYTVPTDDLLAIMMKRSDNFLAEQVLIMIGKYKFDLVSDFVTIRNLRSDIFASILGDGRWTDGSGLSRNNLIAPNEFIELLEQMYKEGLVERVNKVLPSGNQGTLSGYYKGYEDNIHAKTGTLADHLGLSGYLKTKKNSNLAFSFLINNHRGSANEYRRKIEEILVWYIENE